MITRLLYACYVMSLVPTWQSLRFYRIGMEGVGICGSRRMVASLREVDDLLFSKDPEGEQKARRAIARRVHNYMQECANG